MREQNNMPSKSDDEAFEEIIEGSELKKWFEDNMAMNQLTIGDLYEGSCILSQVQVELHTYLMKVMKTLYENNKAGEVITQLPRLTPKQVVSLINIFENAQIFLEDFKD